jgi:hypothetical protein
MARRKEPQYFYAVLGTPYLSKEDLWSYRPKGVVIVLSDYDVAQIQKYIEFTSTKDNNRDNRNSEGIGISIKYPVEAELVIYNYPEQSMFDDDCEFYPDSGGIHICGDYMFFKMCDYNDTWDIAEAEFSLSDLRPMKEWDLDSELEFNNLEN